MRCPRSFTKRLSRIDWRLKVTLRSRWIPVYSLSVYCLLPAMPKTEWIGICSSLDLRDFAVSLESSTEGNLR